jgi:hypothetical protein
MPVTVYRIQVDRDGNAKVTREPFKPRFKQKEDTVKFVTNNTGTVIKFRATTPFEEIQADKEFAVKDSSGPFTCVNVGDHHFDCGRMLNGSFSKWADTRGDDLPVDPGGPG